MRNYLIYMASGSGRRFGSNKLLALRNGKPLFSFGLSLLEKVSRQREDCTAIVVSRYEEIRSAAQALGIQAVDCPESVKGASYTIKAGIRAIEELNPHDRLIFLVADQPELQYKSLNALLDYRGTDPIARLSAEGVPGNPVLFSGALLPELLALTGDQGGGTVAKRHSCTLIPVEPRQLQDCDTPQDLAASGRR